MISQKAIQYLYKEYNERPESPDCLDFDALFSIPSEYHCISINEENIEICSISQASPFRTISLRHINAIVNFEENIAIVLNNSIIFLSKLSKDIFIDIKHQSPSVVEKIKQLFHC